MLREGSSARKAAIIIRARIEGFRLDYIENGNLADFKEKCQNLLSNKEGFVENLNNHVDIKRVLLNLMAFILTLGMAHTVYSMYKGHLTFFDAPAAAGDVKKLGQDIMKLKDPTDPKDLEDTKEPNEAPPSQSI